MNASVKFRLSVTLGELKHSFSLASNTTGFAIPEVVTKLKSEAEEYIENGDIPQALRKARQAVKAFWTCYREHLAGEGKTKETTA